MRHLKIVTVKNTNVDTKVVPNKNISIIDNEAITDMDTSDIRDGQINQVSEIDKKGQNQIEDRYEKAFDHLRNNGELVILEKIQEEKIFPDPKLLIDSLRIVLNHNLKSHLSDNKTDVWPKGYDGTDKECTRRRLFEEGFMSKEIMKSLCKKAKEDNEYLFNGETIVEILLQENFACEWTYEEDGKPREQGWLIPSLIRKSVTCLKKKFPPKLNEMDLKTYWKMECQAVSNSIGTTIGVGVGHRMMLNLLRDFKGKSRSIECLDMANQPLQERDPGVVFIFIGKERKELGKIILTEEERCLRGEEYKDCDPFPHERVLRILIENKPLDAERKQELIDIINNALENALQMDKPIEQDEKYKMMEICPREKGPENGSDVIPLPYPRTYPNRGRFDPLNEYPSHKYCLHNEEKTTDHVEGQDSQSVSYSHIFRRDDFDPPPPDDDAKSYQKGYNMVKTMFTIISCFSTIWTIIELATNQGIQDGKFWYCWVVLLAIQYFPALPNMILIISGQFTIPSKIVLVLLQLCLGPAMSAVVFWLWLCNSTSNDLWGLRIKTNINFGVLSSSAKVIFTWFMYSYGIIGLPWNKPSTVLEDTEGNTISIPMPTLMFALSFLTLIYSVFDSWTKFPPQDRQDNDGDKKQLPLLDPIAETRITEYNQLEYKRKLYISFIFSVLITAFRLLSIFLVTIYLPWWFYLFGVLISLISFGGLYYSTHVIQNQAQYSKDGIIWLFCLLFPIPTPAFSKRATHTLLLHHTLVINITLLILLYVVLHYIFIDEDFKVSQDILIPTSLLAILTSTCAVLMPLSTFWHYWLTWAHTHRRILPKFENETTGLCILRKTLIYLGTVLTLGLSTGLVIFSCLVDTTAGNQTTVGNQTMMGNLTQISNN